MKKQGIDCWLAFSREGSDLLLPYVMGGEYLVGQAALMIFAEGPTVAIVADYDVSQDEGEFDIIHAYHGDWKEPVPGNAERAQSGDDRCQLFRRRFRR